MELVRDGIQSLAQVSIWPLPELLCMESESIGQRRVH
jgi:hypothetical protein